MAKKKISKKKRTKKAKKKKIKKAKITKSMTLKNVLKKYPKTGEFFVSRGLMCAVCGFSEIETIDQMAKSHGMDVNDILKELNKLAK